MINKILSNGKIFYSFISIPWVTKIDIVSKDTPTEKSANYESYEETGRDRLVRMFTVE